MMCQVLGITRDAYYKRCRRAHSRFVKRGVVLKLVDAERTAQPRVGTRKLYHTLKPQLVRVRAGIGRDKMFDLLRAEGLLVKPKRRFQKTTYSRHHYAVAPNLVKKQQITAPNEVFVCDCTYLRVRGGFAYLFLVTDAYSRKILGWHLSRDLGHRSALAAVDMAVTAAGEPRGVIHHSDRGVQYCCHEYLAWISERGVVPSMTDESHCYQNAVAERVNGILKDEFNLDAVFERFEEARFATDKAVRIYNSKRKHWSLNLKTPSEVYAEAAR
jgi:putative transposase